MGHVIAGLLGVILVGQSGATWAQSPSTSPPPTPPASAKSPSRESTLEQMGYGTGSVIGSVVYFPLKAAFCVLGGVGGGVTLAVAGYRAADKVVGATCRGTWVITPDVVKGKERVQFVGEGTASGD